MSRVGAYPPCQYTGYVGPQDQYRRGDRLGLEQTPQNTTPHVENIPIVPLYRAAVRRVVRRDDTLIMIDDDRMRLEPGEEPEDLMVRFRTLGCYPLTGAVESPARTLPEIIEEMIVTRHSERIGRVIDRDESGSMEVKKRQGYF